MKAYLCLSVGELEAKADQREEDLQLRVGVGAISLKDYYQLSELSLILLLSSKTSEFNVVFRTVGIVRWAAWKFSVHVLDWDNYATLNILP